MEIRRLVTAVSLVGATFWQGVLAAELPLRIKSSARGNVFVSGEEARIRTSAPVPSCRWVLRDWARRPLKEGDWGHGEEVSLGVLEKGYYFVTAEGCTNAVREGSFCVVPNPGDRQSSPESFFATDAALSWVCSPDHYVENWYGENSYAACLDLIRLCGLKHVRERMRTREVSSSPGHYNWGRYGDNARLAKAQGISLLGMFHDSPSYVSADSASAADLLNVYRFCRDVGSSLGDAMDAWEYWNEPDISFWHGPVWKYAAAMKAAYLGFKAADGKRPVLNGSTSKHPGSPFHVKMFQNDLAKYSNIFNFHVYDPLATFPRFMSDLRTLMKDAGIEGRQIWLTESTTSLEGHPAGVGIMPGRKAHSYAQELVLAEMAVKDYVGMQMLGVSRFYLFTFGAFNESDGTDFGMQRRDGGVKPIYAAVSAATEHLGAARLLGEHHLAEGVRCFVYAQPDGTLSLALWTMSPGDTTTRKPADISSSQTNLVARTVAIPAADGDYLTANWCGTPRKVKASGGHLSLPICRYVTYVDGLKGLSVDVPARRPGVVENYVPAVDEDLSVVLSADFHPADFALNTDKTSVDLVAASQTGRVDLTVWNLSEKSVSGHLQASGAEVFGIPATLTVAPWSKVVVPARLAFSNSQDITSDVTVRGTFGGKLTSRLVANVRNMARFLESCKVVDLDSNRLGFWRSNDTAGRSTVFWDEQESAICFDCDWTENAKADRWVYPVHDLDLPRESLDKAIMLVFEARLDQDKIENDVRYCYLQLKIGGRLKRLAFEPPTREWHMIQVALNGSAPGESAVGTTGFMLGFNPMGLKCRYWIRNLRILERAAE